MKSFGKLAGCFLYEDRTKKKKVLKILYLFLILWLMFPLEQSQAQYFGRNKPKYKFFDFKVLESPHFEIYHYLKSDSTARAIARIHELWYNRHQAILKDTFNTKNPIVFYNHHADFQQTSTIQELIGIGTGGVTEGLKNRVILPFLETNRQTDHVIGHELVHAFQYNILKSGDSTNLYSVRNLPLWMVEGLAEYLSIGRVDAHTAMWMRDAVISKDIPSLEDLTTNPSYFPYRYGQAFWSFVTGIWGDAIIKPLFIATAKYGYEAAMDSVLKLKPEEISKLWQSNLEEYYREFMRDTTAVAGSDLFDPKSRGNINISPVYSPNAQYMAFISERDVISIDIFLMDVKNNRIIHKLSRATDQSPIDDFNYIESVGTFSPDNAFFAYTTVSKGRNALIVVDIESGKTVKNVFLPGLESFNYPNWSPDGRFILLSGSKEGQSDLYLYDYYTGNLEPLTQDLYADIQATWSSDGHSIVFASDRGDDTHPEKFKFGSFRLCIMDLPSREIEVLDVFPGADNLNPHFSPDNQKIYFLSNADGFRNLYAYHLKTADTFRLTQYFTGISGITAFSPALTVARDRGQFAYSLFRNGKYSIYKADSSDFMREKVNPYVVNFRAATLPPERGLPIRESKKLMDSLVWRKDLPADTLFFTKPYRPRFQLDYIGNHTIGISAGQFGTGLVGGVNALFTDILGNQQLFGALALNGEIYDFGGQIAFINQKRALQWGSSLSFIPFRSAGLSYFPDEIEYGDTTLRVIHEALDILRTYEAKLGLFAYYPVSKKRRFEAGASFARYHYRLDRISNYYYEGYFLGADREKMPTPEGFNIYRVDAAFVEDNTTFGMVGPLKGRRFRFGAEQFFGVAHFSALLADYRQYFRIKPFTAAFRLYHYGRYGDSDLLPPLFLGFPTLIRGYSGNSFYNKLSIETGGFNINQLMGSRIMVGNAELRLPFTGPERLSLLKFTILPSELAIFTDGGIAWDSGGLTDVEGNRPVKRKPVFSSGISLRLNILGYMVIEPFYAIPMQREFKGGVFGLNFTPSW